MPSINFSNIKRKFCGNIENCTWSCWVRSKCATFVLCSPHTNCRVNWTICFPTSPALVCPILISSNSFRGRQKQFARPYQTQKHSKSGHNLLRPLFVAKSILVNVSPVNIWAKSISSKCVTRRQSTSKVRLCSALLSDGYQEVQFSHHILFCDAAVRS